MVLIGLILVLLGAGLGSVGYLGVSDKTGTVHIETLGFSQNVVPLELVGIGAAAMLLVGLGWACVASAARRRSRFRHRSRELDRLKEYERAVEADRLDQERRFETALLRDEDLRRRDEDLSRRDEDLRRRDEDLSAREDDLSARAEQLHAVEREFVRLEEAYRARIDPALVNGA